MCAFTFMKLRGQIRARTWCCKVVGGCNGRLPTSSQLIVEAAVGPKY